MKILSLSILFAVLSTGIAQYRNQSELKLEEIMKGNDFIGHQPQNHQFLPNGNVIFEWQSPQDSAKEPYFLDIKTKRCRKLTEEEQNEFPSYNSKWNTKKTVCYYLNGNKLFRWDVKSNTPQLLLNIQYQILEFDLSSNDNIIFTLHPNEIIRWDFNTLQAHQVIKLSHKTAEYDNQEATYLQKQHNELFTFDKSRGIPKTQESKLVNCFVGKKEIYNLSVSPDEQWITFTAQERVTSESTMYIDYVNNSGYSTKQIARPKVGRAENKYELIAVSLKDHRIIKFSEETLPELNKIPDYYSEYGRTEYKNRGVIYHKVLFRENSNDAIVEIKSLDNKNRWICILDFQNEKLNTLVHQYDSAWIGGPGIYGWKAQPGILGWLPNSTKFYYTSEKTGFAHLYVYDIANKSELQLTSGNFEIYDVFPDKKGQKFYITSNFSHPGNRGFYEIILTGADWSKVQLTPLLNADGYFDVLVSPDEKQLCYLYSYKNIPWEVYLTNNGAVNKPHKITESTHSNYQAYNFSAPEVLTFLARDGQNIYARVYRPNIDKNNGAGVIFVHGAGYLQNAHNYWSVYYREFMFHHFLADNGYTVLDIDYRGSEGYGRNWRTDIYRYMGGKDLDDVVDGAHFLIEKEGVNRNKVGIYGGSYGGFITLMALFTQPDVFKCGAALRSVTDWAHYNHEYTSNILNTPEEDEIAFKRSSPIYFAENLKSRLLMLHGVLDDNVQYQDIIRLTQRLIELEKDNWELASYPVEPHSFKYTSSWLDEYKRIYKLFEEELND